MSDHTFYELTNGHNQRELTIVNVALLVGKAPTKEKRIRIKVRMILSGHPNMGAPEWLSACEVFVSQHHDVVSPSIEFKGYDLHFSADNLFGQEGTKSPRCTMRSFEVHECGDSEEPDVACSFVIYTGFSTALWAWLGQYGGDSCFCSFTPGLGDPQVATLGEGQDTFVLSAGDESDDEINEGEGSGDAQEEEEDDLSDLNHADDDVKDDIPEEEEEPVAAGKSGPADLKAYHEKELDKEQAKGKPKRLQGFGKFSSPSAF